MDAGGSPLLEQLRDIHGAGQPPWWPPAPGWWLLAALVLLVLVFLLRKLWRWHRVRSRRKAWLRELDDLGRRHEPEKNPREYLAGINRLFRAVAVRAFPDAGCARLQGEAWVAWIRRRLPEFSGDDALGALSSGPYEPSPAYEPGRLRMLAAAWVKHYG